MHALAIGFKGADFTAVRRAKMIRQEWALISLIVNALVGLAVLAPLLFYVFVTYISTYLSKGTFNFAFSFNFAVPVIISAAIAIAITAAFYFVNVNSAKELFRKAET